MHYLNGEPRSGRKGRWHGSLVTSGLVLAALTVASCTSSDDPVTMNDPTCRPGLTSGFAKEVGDSPIDNVDYQAGDGIGGGGGGGDSIGGGGGNGIGGGDGQYKNVSVTVESADGTKFGPTLVDDTKGMVTFVPCGTPTPVKVTMEGLDVDATYYDEGLERDVSFFQEQRIGLITSYTTNAGVTPLTHALFDRTMELGRQQGNPEGWKDPAIIGQAHAELLALINDQLPPVYRITDIRRLPVVLNALNDRLASETFPDNANGTYGAVLAGLAKTASANLPNSQQPALDIADILRRDLRDGRLNLKDPDDQILVQGNNIPYTYQTLWSQTSVGTGESATRNGTGVLQTINTVIGYARHKDDASTAAIKETEFILTTRGELLTNLDPDLNGGNLQRPAPGVEFSQLLFFAASQPVAALRRDGLGVYMFPTASDGSAFFEVAPQGGLRFVELMDGASPVVRMSDGTLMRFNAANRDFVDEPIPDGVTTFTFRPEFANALPAGRDADLGADPNGDENNGLCIGASYQGTVRLWRPVFSPGQDVNGVELPVLTDIVQVSSDQMVTVGLQSDGTLYHLDANHSVRFLNADGTTATVLDGDETRELLRPGADPVVINGPRICWTRAPYVIGCDGTAYEIDYSKFADVDGAVQGAGPVNGLRRLPIPVPVWRTRANRGDDVVFIGTDGKVYLVDGTPLSLPI